MSDNTDYEKCWCDIEILLHKIEDALRLNKQKHIIIYWLDALDYKTSKKMDFFSEKSDHSICFTNAFTVTPFTLPTCKTMFCNIRQVDDLGYKIRHIGLDNSPLLQDIMKHGYDFRAIGGELVLFFDERYNYSGESRKDAPCSEVFWNLADQIMRSKQPTVYLVHALIELHIPRISVQRNRFEEKYVFAAETREAQARELNAQLHFYDDMLGENFYRIYMGDHGPHGPAGLINHNVHVPFQIYYSAWKKQIWNKLFCYLDFPILLHQLLIGGDMNEMLWDREFVPIQDVDYYSADKLKQFVLKSHGLELHFFFAYKGVITSDYIYLYYKNGDEIFHKWADGLYIPSLELNNSQENPALYQELREKAGEFPKELDADPIFKHIKDVYIVYENVKKTVKKAVKLLNDKLVEYPDHSIALRAGGNHTFWLLSLLAESSKKKIGGIIDNNSQCMCKDMGYTIYSSGDHLPDSIQTILLSTYDNLETLQAEAENIYPNLEVINIYRYWETKGHHFTGNFWGGLEEDWNIAFFNS